MKRKAVASLLTFVTALTMTACSFQFDGDKVADAIAEEVIQISLENLSENIDNTDFTDNQEVGKLATEISQWAKDVTDGDQEIGNFQKATLVRVVDGDTIVVNIENDEYKVRLIGINTPESVASKEYLERTGKENTEEGRDASEYLKALLADVDTVYLQKDVSDTDRYGRLLRYVWLEVPNDERNINEISEKMLNGLLVWEGIAEPAPYTPDVSYEEEFSYLNDYSDMEF